MSEPTQADIEAAQKDLADRIKHFNEELIPLLGKYRVGLGASAFLLPDGRIGAKPVLVDDSKAAEKAEANVETAEA